MQPNQEYSRSEIPFTPSEQLEYAKTTLFDYEKLYSKLLPQLPINYLPEDITRLTSDYAMATQNKYLSAFIYKRRLMGQPIDEFVRYQRRFRNDYLSSYAKKNEEIPHWPDIMQLTNTHIQNYEVSDKTDSSLLFQAACASAYTHNPPMRLMEFFGANYSPAPLTDTTKILEYKKNTLFSSGKFLIKDYKTAKQHGVKIIDISPITMRLINKLHELTQSKRVFPGIYNHYAAINLFHSTFGNITSSDLRKSYITWHVPNMTREERAALAKIMGHTISTQELNYNKNGAFNEAPAARCDIVTREVRNEILPELTAAPPDDQKTPISIPPQASQLCSEIYDICRNIDNLINS